MASSGGGAKGLVSIIVIIAAAAFLYWYYGSGPAPGGYQDRQVLTIDAITGKSYEVTMKVGDEYPLKNPDTGKRTLWMAYASYEHEFIYPGPVDEPVMACPITGGRTGGATVAKHKNWPVRIPEGFQP